MSHDLHNWYDCRDTLDVLESVCGFPFSLYQRTDGWQPLGAPEPSVECAASDQIMEVLERAFQPEKPVVCELPPSQSLVIVPLETAIAPAAAVAMTDIVHRDCLARLAAAALRILKQRQENGRRPILFEQLADLMEECTWLRGLSQYIELCDANQTADLVAGHLLPRLKDMVKARAIGFVAAPLSRLQDVWCGDTEDVDARSLVEQHGPKAAQRPVVVNTRTDKQSPSRGPCSLIMVRIGAGERLYGWLLAVDRIGPLIGGDSIKSRPSELEFGTVEAGLMEAAAALLATHSRNVDLFRSKERLFLGVIQAMSGAVDARDPYTKGHSDRVALYAREIAHEMGFDGRSCEQIYLAGLLHDIGKIGIPDAILKKPGKLTDDEWEIIKKHPEIGHTIVQRVDDLAFVLPGVLHHHERADGEGYPHGLREAETAIEARILAVADAYDAMTSSRSYRPGLSLDKAEGLVRENAGTQFSPDAVEAFLRALPKIRRIATADARRRLPYRDDGHGTPPSSSAPLLETDFASDPTAGFLQDA